jgi:uncharacterized protein (DUF2141 family)
MLLSFLFFLGFAPKNGTLTIDITNVNKNVGNVMVAIHNKDNFLKTRLIEKSVAAQADHLKVTFDLPQGEYAIAVYQDNNNNQRLDTNLFGVPQEPYGFSNNVRPKFRAPNFEEAKIQLKEQQYINIKLQSW